MMIRLTALLVILAGLAHAQPPTRINPGSPIYSAVVNANFTNLYNGKVGRWFSSGAPGNFPFSLRGDTAQDTVGKQTYTCYAAAATPCTAVGFGNWQLDTGGGGGSGCNPVGLVNRILSNDGAGGCIVTSLQIAGNSLISPILVGAALGTPVSGLGTFLTGIPISTGISGMATGISAFLANPTSALLLATMVDKTGTGSLVFGNSPVLLTPTIGNFTAATHSHANAAGGGQLNIPSASNATGTPSASTFFRGDNVWASVGGVISGLTGNKLPKASSSTTITDSSLSDDGTTVSTPEDFSFGVGSGKAGAHDFTAGTVTTVPANSFGIGVGPVMTTSVRWQSPNAVPTANSVPLLSVPDVNHISTFTYAPRTFACQPGLGDGLNAIAAGTYLESICWNKTNYTLTITGIQCFTDNAGTSSMNVTNGAGTALLTGAVTCSSTIASGTQSGTVTLANNDFFKFTFVADGTSKQTTWVISGTY